LRLVVDAEIPEAEAAFSEFGEVRLVEGRTLAPHEIRDADVLLVRSVTRVDRALLTDSRLRIVGTATAGMDHLDTRYLDERSIDYFNAGGCNAQAVAEYVLACAFLLARLEERPPDSVRIGIIGYGHVGKRVAAVFSALGIRCVLCDPPLAARTGGQHFADLDDALDADIVTLHVPLTESGAHATRGMIGAVQLRRLRRGTVLINTARGGVVDEAALADVPAGRAIVLDCWIGEPLIDLRAAQLVSVATPHIAGHAREARLRATSILSHELATRLDRNPTWSMPAAPLLDLDHGCNVTAPPLAVIRAAVLHGCDPRVATFTLRDSLALAPPARRRSFDRQRREAIVRREFASYRIASARLQPDTIRTLQALGFHTTMHDTA
jgi:erythronate-4-phosphate dehydrogenase